MAGQRRPRRTSPPFSETRSREPSVQAPDALDNPAGDDTERQGQRHPEPGEQLPDSRIIYIREPRARPELATAILALAATFVAGLILGASGVLIWDTYKHSDACGQAGPHVGWDQDLYRCVHEPVR